LPSVRGYGKVQRNGAGKSPHRARRKKSSSKHELKELINFPTSSVALRHKDRSIQPQLFALAALRGKIMSKKPTATAVAGKFQSKDGSDLVQYLNSQGQVVLWINADGVLRINTTAAQGAVLQMGLPNSGEK
jgi:hypothetical protein